MTRILRLVLGVVLGYAVVAGSLTLIVLSWWVNETLPVTAPWVVLIAFSLTLAGGLAGFCAARVAGRLGRLAVLLVAGLTVVVMAVNIALDVAAEPLWFKLLVLALVVPVTLLVGDRAARSR